MRHNITTQQRKRIYERDLVCQGCGMSGTEVHHIVLASQIEVWTKLRKQNRELEYLVLLCRYCHRNAPDIFELSDKKAFIVWKEYLESGGAKIPNIMGCAIGYIEKNVECEFKTHIPMARVIIKGLQQCAMLNALEKYGSKNWSSRGYPC